MLQERAKLRRNEHDPSDTLARQYLQKQLRIAHCFLRDDHIRNARQQRAKNLPDGIDEPEVGLLAAHVARHEGIISPHPRKTIHGAAMRSFDAFGGAGRSRSVDHIRALIAGTWAANMGRVTVRFLLLIEHDNVAYFRGQFRSDCRHS
jgi:hypothetical protein